MLYFYSNKAGNGKIKFEFKDDANGCPVFSEYNPIPETCKQNEGKNYVICKGDDVQETIDNGLKSERNNDIVEWRIWYNSSKVIYRYFNEYTRTHPRGNKPW